MLARSGPSRDDYRNSSLAYFFLDVAHVRWRTLAPVHQVGCISEQLLLPVAGEHRRQRNMVWIFWLHREPMGLAHDANGGYA